VCSYKALGIRLDSGDLSYFSIEARRFFQAVEKEFRVEGFGKLVIVASNDINEETLDALNKQVCEHILGSFSKFQLVIVHILTFCISYSEGWSTLHKKLFIFPNTTYKHRLSVI
jgi:hypothetical protein